jgi:hypothetical protein
MTAPRKRKPLTPEQKAERRERRALRKQAITALAQHGARLGWRSTGALRSIVFPVRGVPPHLGAVHAALSEAKRLAASTASTSNE